LEKKTSNGRESALRGTPSVRDETASCKLLFPAEAALKHPAQGRVYTLAAMWEWYRIGLFLGLGTAIGTALAGLLAPRRALMVVVAALAAVAGAAAGYAFGWGEAVAGAVGAVVATIAVSGVVAGTLARGGTRGGTAALGVLGGLVLALLALVPAVGFLEAVGVPVLAARARKRRPARHAGLRSLARD